MQVLPKPLCGHTLSEQGSSLAQLHNHCEPR